MTTTVIQPATYLADASIARWSVKRYQHMIETGVVTPDDKVELLENLVVLKKAKSPIHEGTIDIVGAAMRPALPAGYYLRAQQAIELGDSQPEPDFGVVRGNIRSYLSRHPKADDIALLIEVANTSLLRDQRDKARIYARAGIPAYWIVNLDDRRVEVHEQPSGPTASPAYASVRIVQRGDTLALPVGGSVAVADLLP